MSVLSASPLSALDLTPFPHSHSSPNFAHLPAFYNSGGGYHPQGAYYPTRQQVARQPSSARSDPVHPAAQGYFNVLAHSMSSSSFPSPIVSERGMLIVHGYSPVEGEAEALLTVHAEMRVDDSLDPSDPVVPNTDSLQDFKMRIVLGRTALRTFVRDSVPQLEDDPNGTGQRRRGFLMRICASIPSYPDARFPEQTVVPMTLQILTQGCQVYESVTFGTFTYWQPNPLHPSQLSLNGSPSRTKRAREDDEFQDYTRCSPSLRLPHEKAQSAFSLIRTSSMPQGKGDSASTSYPAVVEWVPTRSASHPNDLEYNWTAQETVVGRRLVRFSRTQDGARLLVSCDHILQDDYDEQEIVISCIRREDKGTCWFTSVDVIYLLERLVGDPFSVEEKNRIRRNLEGFKPTTVSKHKPGFEAFFQQIMDFPPPKPRNIEKDVKVFPWPVLSQAIEKIMSKYSVCATDEHVAQSSGTPSPESVISVLPSDVGQSSSGSHHEVVPTLVDAYPSVPASPSQFQPAQLLHASESSGMVGYDSNGPLHGFSHNGFTYPQPNEDDNWHGRAASSGLHEKLQTPGLLHHDILPSPYPSSPVLPFTNAYVRNPTNITLNELSSLGVSGHHRLDKSESFAHITPMSSSPALLHLNVNGIEGGPITRSSSVATSLELGYPKSYSESPISEVASHFTNGIVPPGAIPYSDFSSSNSVSYEDLVNSH